MLHKLHRQYLSTCAINKCDKATGIVKDRPGILLEAVAVYRRRTDVEGVRRGVDLQRLRQTPVSLQSSTFLVTFKPEKTNV